MKKKPGLKIYWLFAFTFVYLVLLGFTLYHYYLHYILLQSGLVILVLMKFFFLPIFICTTLILNKRINKGPFRMSEAMSLSGAGFALTIVISFLFLGLIPFINHTIGWQAETTLSGRLIKKSRESGRLGVNEQHYYTVYDSTTREQFTLRGPNGFFYGKKLFDPITVKLRKGSLGILYLEQ